ncbi:MAG: hypothetical protein VB817_08820, partial [Pirellulaceae bacterium]
LLVILLMAVVAAPLAAQQQNKKKKQPTLAQRTLKRFAKAELTEEQTGKIKELATKAEPGLAAAKKESCPDRGSAYGHDRGPQEGHR